MKLNIDFEFQTICSQLTWRQSSIRRHWTWDMALGWELHSESVPFESRDNSTRPRLRTIYYSLYTRSHSHNNNDDDDDSTTLGGVMIGSGWAKPTRIWYTGDQGRDLGRGLRKYIFSAWSWKSGWKVMTWHQSVNNIPKHTFVDWSTSENAVLQIKIVFAVKKELRSDVWIEPVEMWRQWQTDQSPLH